MQSIDTESTTPKPLRRIYVRCFVLMALIAIAIDTAPGWKFVKPLQEHLRPALSYAGLWQGEWPLFAPNPTINNSWLSAEFYVQGAPKLAPDGKPLSWNSPVWSSISCWTKFYRIRHINYFNRIAYRGKNGVSDLADYLARTELGPDFHFSEAVTVDGVPADDAQAIELRLSMNRLQLVMPDDGSLPSPEETTWMSLSSNLALRKYVQ
jgi:hypothetical protein